MNTVSFRACELTSGRRLSKETGGTRIPTATSIPTVRCSFDTRQFGILQVEAARRGDRTIRIEKLPNEPDLHLFTDEEREYIEAVCTIVYRFAFQCRNP